MKLRVWKWYHNWGDDTSTNLYSSEAAAIQAIHHYVQQQWEEGVMDDEEFSGIDQQDIQKYFEWHEDQEWYSLDNQMVEFPEIPAVQDEDVILSSEECEAILCLGADPNASEQLRYDLGLDHKDQAEAILDSIHQKLKD